jgi:hypothetical protein
MPDENKLKILADHEVRIVESCVTCKHSSFKFAWWGICKNWSYLHAKHMDARFKPAHVAFVCKYYIEDPEVETKTGLGKYFVIIRSWMGL